MNIVRKIGLLGSAIILAAGVQVAQAAETATSSLKVAVVNVQQILQQSPKVAELSKKLEGDFKGRQTKLNEEQQNLQVELDKFKKDSTTMSQKDRDSMQKKVETDRTELVKKVVAYQQDLQKEQNKIMQGILNNLNTIVSAIAKDQKYALVLDSQAVVFAVDGNDITKEVAKKFNEKS